MWCSPLVLVVKTDGSVWFCVEYPYPMPQVDELLDRLGTAHFFTTLDFYVAIPTRDKNNIADTGIYRPKVGRDNTPTANHVLFAH